ncbi:MAG: phage portal protein [Acidobacteriota bacterium]
MKMFESLDRRLAGAARRASGAPLRSLPGITPGSPYYPDWDAEKASEEGLKASAVVYRCVMGKAEKAASVPWCVWQRADHEDVKGEPVPNHEYARLIEHPRRDGRYGRAELIASATAHLDLAGNALVRMLRAGIGAKVPMELNAEVPVGVEPIPHPIDFISEYQFDDAQRGRGTWPAEEIIHARRVDPGNPIWGLSVVQALARLIDLDVERDRMMLRRMVNDGRPSVILTDEALKTTQEREDVEDWLADRAERYRGGFMVLGGNQGLLSMGMSSRDLQQVESGAFTRDMLAIGFGYLAAGFSNDAATYSNAEIFVRHEWAGPVMSSNRILADAFTRALVPPDKWGEMWIAPDYSSVEALRENFIDKAKALRDLRDAGVALNDAKRYLDMPLPDQAGGDVPIVPGNYLPAEMLADEARGLSDG